MDICFECTDGNIKLENKNWITVVSNTINNRSKDFHATDHSHYEKICITVENIPVSIRTMNEFFKMMEWPAYLPLNMQNIVSTISDFDAFFLLIDFLDMDQVHIEFLWRTIEFYSFNLNTSFYDTFKMFKVYRKSELFTTQRSLKDSVQPDQIEKKIFEECGYTEEFKKKFDTPVLGLRGMTGAIGEQGLRGLEGYLGFSGNPTPPRIDQDEVRFRNFESKLKQQNIDLILCCPSMPDTVVFASSEKWNKKEKRYLYKSFIFRCFQSQNSGLL